MSSTDRDDAPRTLDDLIGDGTVLMVGTAGPDGVMHSRPITVAAVDGGRISCVVDGSADWATGLGAASPAHVTVSDTRANTWLSLSASATMTTAPTEIDRVWSAPAGTFFAGGRDDPNVAVLYLDCQEGGYWTTPSGRLGTLVAYARAKLQGSEDAGDHGDVEV